MFSLAQQERRVILFLVAMALIGIMINFLAKINSPIKPLLVLEQNLGKVDLNSTDKDTLMCIPGIGEKLAQRILAYRESQVQFRDIEELKNITGITDYRYEKIKDFVYVR